jgi:GTP pyrophosphokinase
MRIMPIKSDVAAAAEPLLTERFDTALGYASAAHRSQLRKGTTIPYVSHLLAVASRVLEAGGDEDEAIAALLHDTVEDQGGPARLADITMRFGQRVADLVAGTSDTDETPKPPWRQRKLAYLEHLAAPTTDRSVLLVSAADKLHNARSVVADVRLSGPATWKRFNAGADEQLWYYRSLRDVFRRRLPGPLTDELSDVVGDLEAVTRRRRSKRWVVVAMAGAVATAVVLRRSERTKATGPEGESD